MLILFCLVEAAAFEIEVRPEPEVKGAKITLGEIALIRGAELSAAELKKLKELEFKDSPTPGYKKRLTRVLVDLSIKNLGYQKSQYSLQMPQTITVRRKTIVIKKEEIELALRDYLNKNLEFSGAEFELISRNKVKDLEIAAGEYELKISDQQKINFPNTNLKLEIWREGRKIRQLFYPVKIKLIMEVLTAAQDLKLNSRLSKKDFKLEKKEIKDSPEKIISDFSELDFNNLVLSRSLARGDILTSDQLKIPLAVKWGQKLHLKVKINNIKVSTFVEAKERGKIGEIITVENINSGYQFQVEVISSNEVRLLKD